MLVLNALCRLAPLLWLSFALLAGCARRESPAGAAHPEAGRPAAESAQAASAARADEVGTSAGAKVDCARGDAGPECQREIAILAGGCFWGMEEILRKIPGVLTTEVGYTGGTSPSPTYEDVHTGSTGHAEAVRIVFDPARLSYEDLLEKWFFRMHDPTTLNQQGNDIGTQYRSAIFVTSAAQREIALRVKQRVQASGRWPRPLVTQIVDAGPFTLAEAYHQKYLEKNPGGYTCHYLRD